MMEALQIIAGSWPIAVMVVGVSGAIVVRCSIYQNLENKRQRDLDYAQGNRSVLVQSREAVD